MINKLDTNENNGIVFISIISMIAMFMMYNDTKILPTDDNYKWYAVSLPVGILSIAILVIGVTAFIRWIFIGFDISIANLDAKINKYIHPMVKQCNLIFASFILVNLYTVFNLSILLKTSPSSFNFFTYMLLIFVAFILPSLLLKASNFMFNNCLDIVWSLTSKRRMRCIKQILQLIIKK